MTQNPDVSGNAAQVEQPSCAPRLSNWARRLLAGNPFYLASAGLLLYGINRLSTDGRLVGAEYSMLQFNFCALMIYEIVLVITAIALARRGIWYDALLLVGLTNVFAIVPFSLISRAVFLSSNLALVMSFIGGMLVAVQFWAFKRYIPGLNLPRRLLMFGALLLVANAVAPLRFRAMALDTEQTARWLFAIWLFALPILAGLANFLPRPWDFKGSPAQKRWLPQVFYLCWIMVTAFHAGGIGYATGFEWNYPLLVPLAWVLAWTICLRLKDFVPEASKKVEQTLQVAPLLVPLLAADAGLILFVLSLLNFIFCAVRYCFKERSLLALCRLFVTFAISLGGVPADWLQYMMPDMVHSEWLVCSFIFCLLWVTFLTRDPRIAVISAVSLPVIYVLCFHHLAGWATQTSLLFLLLHSLRWDDHIHRGAGILRNSTGVLWIVFSFLWLHGAVHEARLPVYFGAGVLLIVYGFHAILNHSWKPRVLVVYVAAVFASEPTAKFIGSLTDVSPGFVAIFGSFLLFALGTLAAFTKSKWNKSDPPHFTSPPIE